MSAAAPAPALATATQRADANRTLLAALIASVGMLFTAFAAAYLERRTSGAAWIKITLPAMVWANTAVLLASSVTMEIARRTGKRAWVAGTIVLACLFLLGQLAAWASLRESGIVLSSTAHASFFYLLTALHGVHLLGGLIALAAAQTRPRILGLVAGFWHFMGGIWIYVLILLTAL